MSLITTQPSHWYKRTETGVEACYEVPRADGKGTRAATLADARKLNLWPSYTNILSVLAKPGLEAWKQEQAIMAALTLPRKEGEGMDDFARRVVEDMDAQSATARDFGTRIHAAAEAILHKQPVDDKEVEPFLEQFKAWAANEIEEVYATEQIVFDNTRGIAGRLDLFARLKSHGDTVCDFKSQRVKNHLPTFHIEFGVQLAGYASTIPFKIPTLLSVIIDSNAPGPVWCQTWEYQPNLEMFLHCFELWKWQKGYSPK